MVLCKVLPQTQIFKEAILFSSPAQSEQSIEVMCSRVSSALDPVVLQSIQGISEFHFSAISLSILAFLLSPRYVYTTAYLRSSPKCFFSSQNYRSPAQGRQHPSQDLTLLSLPGRQSLQFSVKNLFSSIFKGGVPSLYLSPFPLSSPRPAKTSSLPIRHH